MFCIPSCGHCVDVPLDSFLLESITLPFISPLSAISLLGIVSSAPLSLPLWLTYVSFGFVKDFNFCFVLVGFILGS